MVRSLFSRFLFSPVSREQRMELLILSLLATSVFIFLRWCYPMGEYSFDSADYVYSAQLSEMRGYRPMGYPWFLQAIHFFTTEMRTVLWIQFFIHLGASLFFVCTIRKFFPPAWPWLFRLFALFTVLNTSAIMMTVWYLSDSLNTSLVLISFSALIHWMKNPKSVWMTVLLIGPMYLAMQTRFASLFLGPAFILSMLLMVHWRKALPGILLIAVAMGGTWIYNVKKNEALFGESIFSGFGGWANANNVSVILPYVEPDTSDWNDPMVKRAYRVFRTFPAESFSVEKTLAADFMWSGNGPGKEFMYQLRKDTPGLPYEDAWVRTGSIYGRFAKLMIREYPLKYLRYFIWPNAKQMFDPRRDLAKFPEYEVPPTFRDYYRVTEKKFAFRYDVLAHTTTFAVERYQLLFIGFFASLIIVFAVRNKLPWQTDELRTIIVLALLVIICLGGLLIAHPVMFRYVGWYSLFFLVPVYALLNSWVRKRSA